MKTPKGLGRRLLCACNYIWLANCIRAGLLLFKTWEWIGLDLSIDNNNSYVSTVSQPSEFCDDDVDGGGGGSGLALLSMNWMARSRVSRPLLTTLSPTWKSNNVIITSSNQFIIILVLRVQESSSRSSLFNYGNPLISLVTLLVSLNWSHHLKLSKGRRGTATIVAPLAHKRKSNLGT